MMCSTNLHRINSRTRTLTKDIGQSYTKWTPTSKQKHVCQSKLKQQSHSRRRPATLQNKKNHTHPPAETYVPFVSELCRVLKVSGKKCTEKPGRSHAQQFQVNCAPQMYENCTKQFSTRMYGNRRVLFFLAQTNP